MIDLSDMSISDLNILISEARERINKLTEDNKVAVWAVNYTGKSVRYFKSGESMAAYIKGICSNLPTELTFPSGYMVEFCPMYISKEEFNSYFNE